MNIVTGPCLPSEILLQDINPGNCLRFAFNLHPKHKVGDVFLRVNAKTSYIPESIKHSNNVLPAVNLRTGELAYVNGRRDVIPVSAEVCVGDS